MGSRGRGAFPTAVLFVGLIGVGNLVQKPRFQVYHTVDVLQLIASGMCFGVALMWLIGRLREKRVA